MFFATMCEYVISWFTIYEATRLIRIRSTFMAISYVVLVVGILATYIWSVSVGVGTGYQKLCPIRAAVVSKVKGVTSTLDLKDSDFDPSIDNTAPYKRIWDNEDLVLGTDTETGSFFIATNMIITANQTKDRCPESPKFNKCTQDSDCEVGKMSISGQMTGKCITYSTGSTIKTCEIFAWCPVELDTNPLKERALLEGVQNFTVMIKNSVEFPECYSDGEGKRWRNIPTDYTAESLSQCRHENKDKEGGRCPIFRLGDVVEWANEHSASDANFAAIATTGAVFQIEIRWDCHFKLFDRDVEKGCFPHYHFSRIDSSAPRLISKGLNNRRAFFFDENRRSLHKIYGIKFLVAVTGAGRQFDYLSLMWTFASTFSLFQMVGLLCDLIFQCLCILKQSKHLAKCFGNFDPHARFMDVTEESVTVQARQSAILRRINKSKSQSVNPIKDSSSVAETYSDVSLDSDTNIILEVPTTLTPTTGKSNARTSFLKEINYY